MMEQENSKRTRIIGLRLTPKEYEQIRKKWKATTCRKLSEYVRKSVFEKPVVTTFRNQSLDDFMAVAILLKNELNSIGSNYNQAVKKLHTLQQIAEFKAWLMAYEKDKMVLMNKVEDIKTHMQKVAEKWLQ